MKDTNDGKWVKTMTYYLDPDYRKLSENGVPHCVRCQKAVDKSKAIKVTLVDSAPGRNDKLHVVLGGTELMGSDCWKKISKEVA